MYLHRITLIGFIQNAVDGILHWPQARLLPFVFLALRWDRAGDRLAHHPTVHAMLLRQSLNRLAGRVSPPDLFE